MSGDQAGSTDLDAAWNDFVGALTPAALAAIRPPPTSEAIAAAEARLGRPLPPDLRSLYARCDGFQEGAYVLRGDYRVLPLAELVEHSLALLGQPVVLDALGGMISKPRKLARLVVVLARPDDPDVDRISLRLGAKSAKVEIWYREGGVHDFEEVVASGETFTEWLEGCVEYYG